MSKYYSIFKTISLHLRKHLKEPRTLEHDFIENMYREFFDKMEAKLRPAQAAEKARIRSQLNAADGKIRQQYNSYSELARLQQQYNSDSQKVTHQLLNFKRNIELSLIGYENKTNACMEHTFLMFLALHRFIEDDNINIQIKWLRVLSNLDLNHCFIEFYDNKQEQDWKKSTIVDSTEGHICKPEQMPQGSGVFNLLNNLGEPFSEEYLIGSNFIEDVNAYINKYSSSILGTQAKIRGEYIINEYKEIIRSGLERSSWIEKLYQNYLLENLYKPALGAYKNGDYNTAIATLISLLPKYASDHVSLAKCHSLLASCYRELGDITKGIEHCNQGLLLSELSLQLRANIEKKLTQLQEQLNIQPAEGVNLSITARP